MTRCCVHMFALFLILAAFVFDNIVLLNVSSKPILHSIMLLLDSFTI